MLSIIHLDMKISIIAPTLAEREPEIVRLIDSLKNQTFTNFEVIFVSQKNHNLLETIIDKYPSLSVKQIKSEVKGLSFNRNIGLRAAKGEIIVLSDDDCWYHDNSLSMIANEFAASGIDMLITKIYDPIKSVDYKKYPISIKESISKLDCLSRSSIEIAFKQKRSLKFFDSNFGLGSEFGSAEEVDFLLNNFQDNKIKYIPKISVYHKTNSNRKSNAYAKGAIYSKHFNFLFGIFTLVRDLLVKKENNFREFTLGYKKLKEIRKS